MGMQGWITPSRKKSCCLVRRQEGGRPFFLYPFLPDFHGTHGKGRPLAFPCPAALGMGDEESFPMGQKMVQDGFISPCFLRLHWCSTLWHHLSTQITFRLTQSWWDSFSSHGKSWNLLFASSVLSYGSWTAGESSFSLVSEDALDSEHLKFSMKWGWSC